MIILPHPAEFRDRVYVVPLRVGIMHPLVQDFKNEAPYDRCFELLFQPGENERGEICWNAWTQSFATGLRWRNGRAVPL